MVNQCANPACNKQLHYLRDGKVFLLPRKDPDGKAVKEHFWLCGVCVSLWTLAVDGNNQVQLLGTSRQRIRASYGVTMAAPGL